MNKLNLIKIGGNLIDDAIQLDSFLNRFAQLEGAKVLVHGGGKMATSMAEKMGLSVQMIEGRRITDASNLEIITMVYGGLINKKIVAQLQAHGSNALGLSGADGNSILAQKRVAAPIDFGFVGDITTVNTKSITALISLDIVPVMSPITHDGKGQLLNTNADTIAATVAAALTEHYDVHLHYCFDKDGVLENINDETSIIRTIDLQKYEQLKASENIAGGMLPKLHNCFEALKKGVQKVHVGGPKMFDKTSFYTKIEL